MVEGIPNRRSIVERLKVTGFQTISAMVICKSIKTGDEILQVNYPQLFIDLLQTPEHEK